VLRVFLANSVLTAAASNRAAGVDNGAESMRCVIGDECDLESKLERCAASGLGTCRFGGWFGFGDRAAALPAARTGAGDDMGSISSAVLKGRFWPTVTSVGRKVVRSGS